MPRRSWWQGDQTGLRSILAVAAVSAVAVPGACGGGEEPSGSPPTDQRVAWNPPGRAELKRLGLTLGPPTGLLGACRKAAAQTELPAVYCPPVTPEGPFAVESAGTFGSDRSTYFIDGSSASLPGTGDPAYDGHWVLDATQPSRALLAGVKQGPPSVTRKLTLAGTPATLFLGAGPETAPASAGHAIVYWEYERVGYVASVHYDKNAQIAREIAAGLIGQMRYCAQPSVNPHKAPCTWVFPSKEG